MEDLGKIAVIAGIMGALLLFGVFMQAPVAVVEEPVPIAIEQPITTIKVLPQLTLEMLDPVYSEKAVFNDGTIRIAFQGALTVDGVESRLPFWLHNVSGDVINIHWDRCSIQLPGGNTVNIVNEAGPDFFAPVGRLISIAPGGDLFDAIIPVSEIIWTDDEPRLTTNVLDKGVFTLVLAIERAVGIDCSIMRPDPGCEPVVTTQIMESREIVYYTFRFVLR